TRDPLHPMQVRYQAALRPEFRFARTLLRCEEHNYSMSRFRNASGVKQGFRKVHSEKLPLPHLKLHFRVSDPVSRTAANSQAINQSKRPHPPHEHQHNQYTLACPGKFTRNSMAETCGAERCNHFQEEV